jgi:hypothetical protein
MCRYPNFLAAALLAVGLLTADAAHADWNEAKIELDQPVTITVYRSPSCGCCHKWIEHLQSHGFDVDDRMTDAVSQVKAEAGVPQQLSSCHTAFVDGYVIEGHVPADDIKLLLQSRPQVAGLSVPGMPIGSPGMEQGVRKDDFGVLGFQRDGSYELFNIHQDY